MYSVKLAIATFNSLMAVVIVLISLLCASVNVFISSLCAVFCLLFKYIIYRQAKIGKPKLLITLTTALAVVASCAINSILYSSYSSSSSFAEYEKNSVLCEIVVAVESPMHESIVITSGAVKRCCGRVLKLIKHS